MLMKFTARQKFKKKLAKCQDTLEGKYPTSKVTKLKTKLEATIAKEAARLVIFEEAQTKELEERGRQRLIE